MAAPDDTISVIVPFYNRQQQVLRAVASTLAQTRAPDEILMIDDASTDGSADAIVALGDSRVRLLHHAHNLGAAAARNTGIAAARGNWIAFLDSDDEWLPEKLALQHAALVSAPPGTDASVTGYIIKDLRTKEERRVIPQDADVTLDALVWGCRLSPGSTLLARRTIFAEVGVLDPSLPRLEDWEWLMRYLRGHRLAVLSQALAIVHKGGDPSRDKVVAAVGRIRQQYRDTWYRRSWLAGRKFDSTLLVEEAAAAHYTGAELQATLLTLRAFAAYPLRPGFPGLLTRRVLQARG